MISSKFTGNFSTVVGGTPKTISLHPSKETRNFENLMEDFSNAQYCQQFPVQLIKVGHNWHKSIMFEVIYQCLAEKTHKIVQSN